MGSQLDPLPLSRVGSRERASKFQLSATWFCGTLKWVSPRDLGARHAKRCLAHLCLLPMSTRLSGKWTKLGVSSYFSHLDEPSLEERERAMGFQVGTTNHTKVTRLECNALVRRSMDLNSLTWSLVTCVLFQMYITPTLIQSTCSSNDATTWHLDQVHLPIFNIYTSLLVVGGRRYHVIWLKLFLIHL
jgi:hypothetical protein